MFAALVLSEFFRFAVFAEFSRFCAEFSEFEMSFFFSSVVEFLSFPYCCWSRPSRLGYIMRVLSIKKCLYEFVGAGFLRFHC